MNFWLLLSLLVGTISAKPPAEELYGFIDYFNADTYHLCPLRGATGIESSWLKNLLRTGNEDHATFQLASKLFNRELLKVSGELTPTTYEPYCHFGAKTIATLLQRLHKGTLGKCNKNGYTALEEIKKSLRGNKKKLPALTELIDLILNSQKEGEVYPAFTPQQIVMAFFYAKSQKSRDLRDLCKIIRKNLKLPPLETARQTPWTEDDYRAMSSWCAEPLNDDDSIPEEFLQPERLIFYVSKELSRSSLVPPGIFYYYQNIDGEDVGDCVEAAVRRLCSILLYNPTTKSLDLSLLQQEHLEKMPRDFCAFFQSGPVAAQAINSHATRNTWFDIISNVDALEYRIKREDGTRCEMHPSATNLLRTFCHIFGLPTLEGEITQENAFSSWDYFCQEFSKLSTLELKCLRVWYQSDTTNSTTFSLARNDGSTVIFTLQIQPEHVWVTIDNKVDYSLGLIQDGKYVKTKKSLLIEHLLRSYAQSSSLITLDLLCLLNPYIRTTDIPGQRTPSIPLCLSHPTENNIDTLRHVQRLIGGADSPQSPLWPYIFKQLLYFQNDIYTGQALCAIIQKNIKQLLAAENIREPLISATSALVQREREQSQMVGTILNHQQTFALFLALIHKQAWHYDGYTDLIIQLLHTFPEFEDWKIDIDCKVFGLLQLLLFHGHQNDQLKEGFMRSLNSLSRERALILYNRTHMSPFSSYDDEDSVSIRREIEAWKMKEH